MPKDPSDLIREEILARMTAKKETPVNENDKKEEVNTPNLLEQCLTHRQEVLEKDVQQDKELRKKIVESVDLNLIERIMKQR